MANSSRWAGPQFTDLVLQPTYEATLQLGSEAKEFGIPLPSGMRDRHVVQLVAKIEGQFEVVVT
jgi:hypothetical protein